MCEALRHSNTQLIFIGSGTPSQGHQFLRSLKFPEGFPGELLLDPTTAVFSAFGLRKSVYASLVPSIINGLMTHGLSAVSEGIRLGWTNASMAGDSWQQGGTFVLGPPSSQLSPSGSAVFAPQVLFHHAERWPGDWKPLETILRAADVKVAASLKSGTEYATALKWYKSLPSSQRTDRGMEITASGQKQFTVLAAAFVAVLVVAGPVLACFMAIRYAGNGSGPN